jgi:hypothetical protein
MGLMSLCRSRPRQIQTSVSTGSPRRQSTPLAVEPLETRMVLSGINQRFVTQMYLDLLHRPVDPTGLSVFGSALDRRQMTRQQVVQFVEGSTEYLTGQVQGLYRSLLHRPADQPGLNGWVGFLRHGGTMEQVRSSIAGSTEYFQRQGASTNQGFLTASYRDLLGRTIDPTGLHDFTQLLSHGTSRTRVADLIFGSLESQRNLVKGLYSSFLHRQGDTAGFNAWVSAGTHGMREELMVTGFVASDEYLAKVP